ncbi:class I SAM-dependent methyltransferase [Thermodesulfobacteriota bacterium]
MKLAFHGATAAIISAALEDVGQGRIVGLDPNPDITYSETLFWGRFKMVKMAFPEGVEKASAITGDLFDMIHLDSINAHDSMQLDIAACLPYLTDPTYLVFQQTTLLIHSRSSTLHLKKKVNPFLLSILNL